MMCQVGMLERELMREWENPDTGSFYDFESRAKKPKAKAQTGRVLTGLLKVCRWLKDLLINSMM